MSLQQFDLFPDRVSFVPQITSPQAAVPQIGVRQSRQRGIVLTDCGWQKLLAMRVLQNQRGEWHTFELLGVHTLLSPRTVSKIVGREIGVDRRTLKQFFNAFDLPLESDDCCLASVDPRNSLDARYKSIALVLHFSL